MAEYHWWEPDTRLEDREANTPWWAKLEPPKTITCPYCLGSLTCSLCEKNGTNGCTQCGFTKQCPLCRGTGEIVNPD